MIKFFGNLYRVPSASELAARELADTKRFLLKAQSHREDLQADVEAADAEIKGLKTRELRLEAYLQRHEK